MKETTQRHLPTILAVALTGWLVFQFADPQDTQAAGPLDPPAGAPGPTMVSLDELSTQITDLAAGANGSSGRNFALRAGNRAVAFDHESKTWINHEVSGLLLIIESEGNFLAVGNGVVAAWSKHTKTWKSQSVVGSLSHLESFGNFAVTGTNSVAAWDQKTGTWKTQSVSGLVGLASSNGNFCAIGNGVAAAYDQASKTWTVRNQANIFQVSSADD